MKLEDFYIGQGSFRDTKTGKIEFNIRYIDGNGNKRSKSFTANTEEECIARALDFAEKYTENLTSDNSTIPQILHKRFSKDLKFNYVKIQSYYRNIETLKIIKRDPIASIPIRKVTKNHITRFLKTIVKYANSTINKIFLQLKAAFRIAKNDGIINDNIMLAHDIKKPKSSKPNKKIRALTEDEQLVFTECLINDKVPSGRNNYKCQLLISLYSGMRMGEVNALSPKDIDLKQNVIHVRKTISRGENGQGFLGESTKTYAGERDVPISKALMPVLKEALAKMKPNELGLVFFNHLNNRVITTSSVNSYYRRLCSKCNIECNGQHSLRHTFATRCIEAGVPAVVLKKWLGHADIHVTLDTYSDVFDGLNNSAINVLDAYLETLDKETRI